MSDKGRAGAGRPPGAANKITKSIKEAFLAVYNDLQDEVPHQSGHGHLLQWAQQNPSDFYRICAKMIPQQLNAEVNGTIEHSHVHSGLPETYKWVSETLANESSVGSKKSLPN